MKIEQIQNNNYEFLCNIYELLYIKLYFYSSEVVKVVIIGVDPGYAIVGIGVIEYNGNKFRTLEYGTITTPAGMPTVERLKKIYDSMNEYIEKYIEAKHLLHGTAKQYRVLGNHLRLFSQLHYTIFAGRVELNDLKAFEHFIRHEAGKHPKKGAKVAELAQNTVNSKMRSMRALCNYCVSIGVAQSNPFDKFQIKQSIYGTPVWLTIEERDKIYHTHFDNPSLERQKDIFIFQCYVGCRVSDLMQMTAANITDDGFVQYIQHKLRTTNPTTVRVPLTDTALEILERYKPKRKGDPLLPFISPQKYNVTIKKVLEEAGITREVLVHNPKTLTNEPKRVCDIAASHLARRTFTANIFKLTKSERITSALTGHVNGSRAFSRYTDIDDDMKISVIAAIDMKKQ